MNPGTIAFPQPHGYVSEEQQSVASTVFTFQLPVSSTPDTVRVVGVCKIAEQGYVAGDEIDSAGMSDFAGPAHIVVVSGPGAVTAITGSAISTQHKTTAARQSLTFANWKLKVYAGWLSPFA